MYFCKYGYVCTCTYKTFLLRTNLGCSYISPKSLPRKRRKRKRKKKKKEECVVYYYLPLILDSLIHKLPHSPPIKSFNYCMALWIDIQTLKPHRQARLHRRLYCAIFTGLFNRLVQRECKEKKLLASKAARSLGESLKV